jgi:hypothetical protein
VTERLTPEEAASVLERARPIPTQRGPRQVRTTFEGVDPAGARTSVQIAGPTVVLALSTTCDGCRELAEVVADGIEGFDVVGLLRSPSEPPPAGEGTLWGRGGRWVLGDDALDALDISSAPFFVVVDATGDVLVEGIALGRAHLDEHLARVLAGAPRPDSVRLHPDPR